MKSDANFPTAEDLRRSFQFYRINNDLRLIKKEIAENEKNEVNPDDNIIARGMTQLNNWVKGNKLEALKEKKKAINAQLIAFLEKNGDTKINYKLIEDNPDPYSIVCDILGSEAYSVPKYLFAINLVLDNEYNYHYKNEGLRYISSVLFKDTEEMVNMEKRLGELYVKIAKKPLTAAQKTTLVGVGAVAAALLIAVPLVSVGGATAALTAVGLGDLQLGVAALTLISCLAGGTLAGIAYGSMQLKNKLELKQQFRALNLEESALMLTIRCFTIEKAKLFASNESFKADVDDMLSMTDDLRADTNYETFVERRNVELNREKIRLFHNFDDTLISILA